MAGLIDTGVSIAWERAGRPARDLPRTIGAPFAMASISASELLTGVLRARPGERRDRRHDFVEILLSTVPVLSFDLEAARVHARFSATMTSSGRLIAANDLLIAATAMSRGHAVVTPNRHDVDRVPGLVVQAPGLATWASGLVRSGCVGFAASRANGVRRT